MINTLREEPLAKATIYALDQYRNRFTEIKLLVAQFCEWYELHIEEAALLLPDLERFYKAFKEVNHEPRP